MAHLEAGKSTWFDNDSLLTILRLNCLRVDKLGEACPDFIQTEDGEVSFSKFARYSLAGTNHRTESMDIIVSTVADTNACNVCADVAAEWNVVSAMYLMLFDVVAFTLQSPMCYARMTFHTLNETIRIRRN